MPSPLRQRLLDLLAIGRVSNLPTVWSNVVIGILLALTVPPLFTPFGGGLMFAPSFVPGIRAFELIVVLLGATCAYLFGTFLNDWKDAEFDRAHRPERAIPANRIRRGTILAIALGLAGGALAAFAALSWALVITCGVLLALIALYTWLHKRSPLAIVPMGLCRACLYVLGFLAASDGLNWEALASWGSPATVLSGQRTPLTALLELATAALGITTYIAGLTLAARYESRPEGFRTPRAFFWFLLFLPVLTHTWWWLFKAPPFLEGWHLAIPALVGLVPFLLWSARALFVLKKDVPDFVSRALAGICLVDLLLLPGIAATVRTGWTELDRVPILLALVPLTLFLLALLLQRIAPAT